MTVINLRLLETLLGTPGPIESGQVVIQYWAGTLPFIAVDGADTTFSKRIVVPIVAGEPTEVIDLEPTGNGCCVRWDIRANKGKGLLTRYTSIPDVAEVDFGDLPVVDRFLFTSNASPTLLDAVAQIIHDTTYDRF